MKLKQTFFTRSEIKRAVYLAHQNNPNQRHGQAFWNTFGEPNETWPELFYEENKEKVIQLIYEYLINLRIQ